MQAPAVASPCKNQEFVCFLKKEKKESFGYCVCVLKKEKKEGVLVYV